MLQQHVNSEDTNSAPPCVSALDPILEELRRRVATAGSDAQKTNAIVMAVAEAATMLDKEFAKTVAGMAVRLISDPLMAAHHDVGTRLWHACGIGLVGNVDNKQRPILALSIVPDGYHREYDAEADRLAGVVREVLERRL